MKGEMAHSEYGLWFLVILNSAIFIILAFSFAKPSKSKDWTSFGAFSAFVIALFTEMYGFPLSIYFLSPWLESQFPNINWFAHDSGHFWEMIFGWKDNPHFGPFHFISLAFIFLGFSVLSSAWPNLAIQRTGHLSARSVLSSLPSVQKCTAFPSRYIACRPGLNPNSRTSIGLPTIQDTAGR